MDPITLEFIKNPTDERYFNAKLVDIKDDEKYNFFRQFGRAARRLGFSSAFEIMKKYE